MFELRPKKGEEKISNSDIENSFLGYFVIQEALLLNHFLGIRG